jgi:hypothetical protein
MHNGIQSAERSWARITPSRAPRSGASHERQAFHHPRTSLGAAGHWIHLGAVAAPLVIGEVIKDPDQRWRALRLASVGAALASEAVWTYRLMKEREKDERSRAVLQACPEPGR